MFGVSLQLGHVPQVFSGWFSSQLFSQLQRAPLALDGPPLASLSGFLGWSNGSLSLFVSPLTLVLLALIVRPMALVFLLCTFCPS